MSSRFNEFGEVVTTSQQDNQQKIEQFDINSIPEATSVADKLAALRRGIQERIEDDFDGEGDIDRIRQVLSTQEYLLEHFGDRIGTLNVRCAFSGIDIAGTRALEQVGVHRENIVHEDFDSDNISTLQRHGFNAQLRDSSIPTGQKVDIIYIMNPSLDSQSYDNWLANVSSDVSGDGVIIGNVIGFDQVGFRLVGRTFYDPATESTKFVSEGQNEEVPENRSTDRDHTMYIYERIKTKE